MLIWKLFLQHIMQKKNVRCNLEIVSSRTHSVSKLSGVFTVRSWLFVKYTAGKLTDNKPNIYTVYQTYIFINILVLASLPKFQYRLGSTLHNYSVCLSWENKGVDYVEVMWHDPDTVIAGWPPGSDEKCHYLQRRGGWRGIENTWWPWCILSPWLRFWRTEIKQKV